jgi:8-oxo-dGTP diphosphatase
MKKNEGAGIIFIHDDKILLLQNDKGLWEIPGGKKNKGEKFLEAAIRETAEEIGYCPEFKKIGYYIHENNKNKFKIYFGLVDSKFECKISDEHIDWKWANIDKLPQQLLHVKVAGAIKFLNKNKLTFNNIDAV